MTRSGPSKTVDKDAARGRLLNARAFLAAAKDAVTLLDDGGNANPAMSHIVNAAIAFTDAMTAERSGKINQQNHAGAVGLLRSALGSDLPQSQVRILQRILGDKDEIQYGIRVGRRADAEKLLQDLETFATWAEEQLVGRS
jgi:hypothetical protein